jgi:hypothetical protein
VRDFLHGRTLQLLDAALQGAPLIGVHESE